MSEGSERAASKSALLDVEEDVSWGAATGAMGNQRYGEGEEESVCRRMWMGVGCLTW